MTASGRSPTLNQDLQRLYEAVSDDMLYGHIPGMGLAHPTATLKASEAFQVHTRAAREGRYGISCHRVFSVQGRIAI